MILTALLRDALKAADVTAFNTSSYNMVSDIHKAFSISIYSNLMVGVGIIYEA